MIRKLPDTITEFDVDKILRATHMSKHKAAIILGFYQGMRISEVIKLSDMDVNHQTGMIHIRQSKGQKDRIIPIRSQARKTLENNEFPLRIGARAVQRALRRISQKAIGKEIRFHTLRHSCATELLNRGLDTRFIQQFLGHENLQTTQIYTHVNPVSLKRVMEGL